MAIFNARPRARPGDLPAIGLGLVLPLVVMLVGVPGCGGAPRAAAVDPPKARDALRTTLEGWKGGAKPDDLRNGAPSITAQDLDWMAGATLVEYTILGDGTFDDANLRIPVELTLRDPGGRQVRKKVSYVVGTSPRITVFREL
jgi:hypothetical protein